MESFYLKVGQWAGGLVGSMSELTGTRCEPITCIEQRKVVEKPDEDYESKTPNDNADQCTLKDNDQNSGKTENELLISEEIEGSNEGCRSGYKHDNSDKRSDEQYITYASHVSENGYELDMGKNNSSENSVSEDEESFLSCRSNSECSYYRSVAPKKIFFRLRILRNF